MPTTNFRSKLESAGLVIINIIMNLEPPPTDKAYHDLDSLIKAVNDFSSSQGYAVVKRRTKVSKKGVLRKAVLVCDRGRKYEASGHGKRRGNTSLRIECEFEAIALLEPDNMWHLTIKKAGHNHAGTHVVSHPSLRKSYLTSEVREAVQIQSNLNVPPQKIIAGLRAEDDDENPRFLAKDIYNAKAAMKRKELGFRTPVQALLRNLEQGDWYFKHEVNRYNQV